MSVYVGAAEWPFGRMMMCHLTADSTEELLRMVDAIGVQRKWIQHPGTPKEHFDICKSKRVKAVAFGAIEVDHQQEVDMLKAKMEREQSKGGLLSKLTPEEIRNCAENPDFEEES